METPIENLKNEAKEFFTNSTISYSKYQSGKFYYPPVILYYGDNDGYADEGEFGNDMKFDCDVWELEEFIQNAIEKTEEYMDSENFKANDRTPVELLIAIGLEEGF